MPRFLLVLLSFTFISACAIKKSNSRSQTTSAPAGEEEVKEVEKFRIFDAEINFVKYYNFSEPRYARERFPVINDEKSTIGVINNDELFAARINLLNQAKR